MSNEGLHWKIVFGGARVVGFVLMLACVVGAVELALDRDSQMDAGLRWGLVGLFVLISVLGFLMVRAPIRRKP
jgi:hypothetical protein